MTCKKQQGLQIVEAMNKTVTFVFLTNVAKEEDLLLLSIALCIVLDMMCFICKVGWIN